MNQSYWLEIQGWGYNALTVSFLATVFFTGFESFGLYGQYLKIKREKSVRSLSTILFPYNAIFFTAMTVYGVYEHSLALTIHALAIIMHLPIVWQLWRYHWRTKGMNRKEACIILFGVFGLLGMLTTSERDTLFMGLYLVRFVGFVHQPTEIYRKGRGVVDIKMLCIFCISAAFWIIYAFAVGDWVLEVAATTIFAILLVSIGLWIKKK